MFKVGDSVVHPQRGAGVIVDVTEFPQQGKQKVYYKIQLLGRTKTSLMIPVKMVESSGLRPIIAQNSLKGLWDVLGGTPNALPSNKKTCYKILSEKLETGDIFQTAEAVRDMTWQSQQEKGISDRSRRLLRKGMEQLVAELSLALEINMAEAEEQVNTRLQSISVPN